MSNVIHGTGKPRITINSGSIHSNIVGSATATTVTLTNAADLQNLDDNFVLVNRVVSTLNSSDEVTVGKITAFDDSTDILTIESWDNGTPSATKAMDVTFFILDFPYAQALIESWKPDTIVKKLFNGNVHRVKRGFYYKAILDYSKWAKVTWVNLIRPLYKVEHTDFIFYPRSDNLLVNYKVDINPETIFAIRQATNHFGHKLVKVVLIGTERLSEINLITPVAEGFGGSPYGGDYGNV